MNLHAKPENAPALGKDTEAPHSCGAGDGEAIEKREALAQGLTSIIHDKSVEAP